mgnify:FL=1
MRYNITVHVPQTLKVSYTLFAKGYNIEIPQLSEDETEFTFKFLGGTVFVLFYNFGRFKKAYVVTGWQDERDGEPISLPGVDGKLCLLFAVRGKRYHILDKIIKQLTKDDEYAAFQLPLGFWYKLGVLIDSRKTRMAYINNILRLYRADGKDFFCSQKEIEEDCLEKRILDFCIEPRTAKEIAKNCGYENDRAFSRKFLSILVEQKLLSYENRKYIA